MNNKKVINCRSRFFEDKPDHNDYSCLEQGYPLKKCVMDGGKCPRGYVWIEGQK